MVGAFALTGGDPPDPPERSRANAEAGDARRLSNERTRSRWAFVRSTIVARRRPLGSARAIAKVRRRTPLNTREVVLALSEARDARGRNADPVSHALANLHGLGAPAPARPLPARDNGNADRP